MEGPPSARYAHGLKTVFELAKEDHGLSGSFNDLIKQPEPRPLVALHVAKVVVGSLAVVALGLGAVKFALGFETKAWFLGFVALLVASVAIALLANRWSELVFARRAIRLGLDGGEARKILALLRLGRSGPKPLMSAMGRKRTLGR